MDVKIICVHVTNIDLAERQINDLLNDGWKLHGESYVAPSDGNKSFVYIQTLTREWQ